jgi:hypothetical protein
MVNFGVNDTGEVSDLEEYDYDDYEDDYDVYNDIIDVKVKKTIAGIMTYGESIIIQVLLDEATGNKYYSYTILNDSQTTLVFKYPEVHPRVYSIMNYINLCGTAIVQEDGSIYGPHLIRRDKFNYYVGYMKTACDNGSAFTFIENQDIVPKDTPLPWDSAFNILIENILPTIIPRSPRHIRNRR